MGMAGNGKVGGTAQPQPGASAQSGGKYGGGMPQQQQGMLRAQMPFDRMSMAQRGQFNPVAGLSSAQAAANGNAPDAALTNPAMPMQAVQPGSPDQMTEQDKQRHIQKMQGGTGYQNSMNQANYPQQWMQQLSSMMRGASQGGIAGLGFAEGGPVAQAPIAWTPTGSNISPGTPSGPVVWNPNQFGGIAPTGTTGGLPAITAPAATTVGVAKYVAPPAIKKAAAAEVAKKAVEKYDRNANNSSNGIYYPGGGNSAWMEGGRGGSHAGFGGTMGAGGFAGRGGGGPGNLGGGLYSLGGMVR